ncbi:MAG: bifunctional nuclease domain-containing protein [Candidatus Binatia bacterium]
MSDERRQIEKLHALLAAFEAESESGEFLELAALAEEIRLLGAPRLNAERRARAREQALRVFRSQWASSAAEENESKEEQHLSSSGAGLDQKVLQRIHEELAKIRGRRVASSTRPAPKPGRRERVKETSGSFWGRLRFERRQLLKTLGFAGLVTLLKGFFTGAHTLSTSMTAGDILGETSQQVLTVKTVLPDPTRETPVMLLEAANTPGRMLPLWIGQPEASAISLALEGKTFPRPMTHDLFLRVLEVVGVQIDHVRITHIEGNTYYATIVMRDMEGHLRAVDARPSDAVALALRAGCPVYATDEVLEQGGISVVAEEEEEPKGG